jgi:hypothetical protein
MVPGAFFFDKFIINVFIFRYSFGFLELFRTQLESGRVEKQFRKIHRTHRNVDRVSSVRHDHGHVGKDGLLAGIFHVGELFGKHHRVFGVGHHTDQYRERALQALFRSDKRGVYGCAGIHQHAILSKHHVVVAHHVYRVRDGSSKHLHVHAIRNVLFRRTFGVAHGYLSSELRDIEKEHSVRRAHLFS